MRVQLKKGPCGTTPSTFPRESSPESFEAGRRLPSTVSLSLNLQSILTRTLWLVDERHIFFAYKIFLTPLVYFSRVEDGRGSGVPELWVWIHIQNTT